MPSIRVLVSQSTNPYWNLAIENWIFRDMPVDSHILYLWRNQETVVIGRFQNPWSECNLEKMDRDGVLLARRQSGGGAVFHDLGNTNFTFMGAKETHNKSDNFAIITRALKHFGIEAYTSGRNDLLVNDHEGAKKISGSAFKNARDRSFHHGTLLINADLGKLAQYLRPHPKKLQSKGIQSVLSRVANLTQFTPGLNHESLCQQIVFSFFEHYGQECPIEIIDYGQVSSHPQVSTYAAELEDWHWRIGETPHFMQTLDERFDWGHIEIHLDSHKGKITRAQVFSDALFPDMIDSLGTALPGKDYGTNGVDEALHEVLAKHPEQATALEELRSWLHKQVL